MKEWLFRVAVFSVLLFPVEGAPQSTVRLNFKTQAVVQKEMVCLGDIATIQGSPSSQVEKMRQTKIQSSPLPGEVLILSREDLSRKLEGSFASSWVGEWQIPSEIEVTRQGRMIENTEVIQFLERHWQKALEGEGRSVRIREVKGLERAVVPSGDLSWEVKAPARISSGTIPVTLVPSVDGQKSPEIRVQARVDVLARVVVAKNYLKKHEVVEANDIQLAYRSLPQVAPDAASDLQEVLGKRTTLSVNTQEILRKSMVEIPPLVKKGDRVSLLIETPHFRVTTLGEVKGEGRAGDQVRVMNISSRKEVSGRVVDAYTVEVDFYQER